jgi:iron complex outermembrane receptor protein
LGSWLEWSLHYTFLDATFRTPFSAPSENHPLAVGGAIAVPAGARLPSTPRHLGKAALTWSHHERLRLGVELVTRSDQILRGDEANLLAPVPGFAVVNVLAQLEVAALATLFVRLTNVGDARYQTFGTLGQPAPVLGPAYDSPRFYGPGAPRALYAGVDLRY